MTTWSIPQPKIILEGTHLTRKTDLAFQLAEHPRVIGERRHRWHIPLVSSEWETKCDGAPTKDDPGRSLITFEEHEEPWAMELYHTWMRIFELNTDYYWIVDRFHLSTRAHQLIAHNKNYQFGWLEERLNKLNFRIVHCTRSSDTFQAAREDRLVYSENPLRYRDLNIFVQEQELMRELIEQSEVPSLEVDVTDGDLSRISTDILDWVEQTGAFYKAKI